MSREVRRVLKDWKHPKNEDGNYIPLHEGFSKDLKEWNEENEKWKKGFKKDWINGGWELLDGSEDCQTYAEWAGERPDKKDYMPEWEDATYIMMYETTSEGTPISPAFKTPEELAKWLFENGASSFGFQTASYESWLKVAKSGYAPSVVYMGGDLINGVDAINAKWVDER